MLPMLIGHDRAKCSLTVQLLLLIMFMPLLSFSEIAGFIYMLSNPVNPPMVTHSSLKDHEICKFGNHVGESIVVNRS